MANHIIVVDDDINNLKTAGHILSRNNIRVTALKSGKALIELINKNEVFPDLILLDVTMPEMDGFETLKRLREKENELGRDKIPVIFLTANEDSDTELQGFKAGVSDYIRKPFVPEILLRRIGNIVSQSTTINSLRNEASTDKLTGFLNKAAAGSELSRMCGKNRGCLMMIDLDSFKLVNDLFGHEAGDKVLVAFAKIVAGLVPHGSVCGRIGGDEFVAFCNEMCEERDVEEFTKAINARITEEAAKIMGEDNGIPLGASVGGVFVPKHGNDYEALLKLADRALYVVKKNGKHGHSLYNTDDFSDDGSASKEYDIETISTLLGERSIPNVALQLDKDAFSYVYRYVMRYTLRNQKSACKALFTLALGEGMNEEAFGGYCDDFGDHVRESLRKSDIIMRSRSNQYFVFLTDIREDSVESVVSGIIRTWHEHRGNTLDITTETEFVGKETEHIRPSEHGNVVVVDDDISNLRMAGHILSKDGLHVTALKSGQALLSYVEEKIPDIILLDIKMPEMDGFETLKKLRSMSGEIADIPVVFLTADESGDTESAGLSLGAMDFIKKPFVPEVLLLRVRHIIELVSLQKNLSFEVERKTRENRTLLMHIVKSLADAIDAKDTYTNGHSGRVAEYSREIAKRAGYTSKDQNDIYMMGLLHDVGKIGIPDAVINKPAKLTNEEFEIIKNHPVMGARILKNIQEMPQLVTGARWHHERYGGGGYPDGLLGEDIPEAARIIAVADAYDAMSSRRSYRDVLPQDVVRSEIEKGMGTQFDPRFAAIMLEMIAEDSGYGMREH